MDLTFSNPRLRAEFTDWPLGGSKRGNCLFTVEHNEKRGYRFSRVTTGKPKTTTYLGKGVIVDGSDGRTYMLQLSNYGFAYVLRSDFMQERTVHGDNPVHAAIVALIESVYVKGNA